MMSTSQGFNLFALSLYYTHVGDHGGVKLLQLKRRNLEHKCTSQEGPDMNNPEHMPFTLTLKTHNTASEITCVQL